MHPNSTDPDAVDITVTDLLARTQHVIGREIEVARKFNRWIDVIVMQRMLQ